MCTIESQVLHALSLGRTFVWCVLYNSAAVCRWVSNSCVTAVLGGGPTCPFCCWRMSAWVVVGSYLELCEALSCSQTHLPECMCAAQCGTLQQ